MLLCLLLAMGSLYSAEAQNATITGLVTEAATGDPLPFLNIVCRKDGKLEAGLGGTTDLDGKYSISIPAGTYQLEYIYLGLETAVRDVTLGAGETLSLDIVLEESANILDEIVFTESKSGKKQGEGTISQTVMKPAFIENAANVDVGQSMDKVPGVNMIDGQANIRGGSGYAYGAGSRVLLLLDDMPMLTGDAGFPYWNLVPIENIDQIEVIKGAASALYGSSALNGIINVRTGFAKSDPVTKASVFGSVYGTPRNNEQEGENPKKWWDGETPPHTLGGSFNHSRKMGQHDLIVGAYYYKDKSWRAPQYEERGRLNLGYRFRHKKIDGLSMGLNGILQLAESASFFLWDGVGPNSYQLWEDLNVTLNERFQLILDPSITYATTNVTHKLRARYFKSNNKTNDGQGINTDQIFSEYQMSARIPSLASTLTAGMVYGKAKTQSDLYGARIFSIDNAAAYIQTETKLFEKLTVALGGRYEYNIENDADTLGVKVDSLRETSGRLVPRIGLNYQAGKATFFRASYGQGYRYPTIAEQRVTTGLGLIDILGNPDLTPETGWSAELGLMQGFAISKWKGYIDVSGFLTEYQKMMEFTFGIDPSTFRGFFRTENISSDTQIYGAEATVAGTGKIGEVNVGILTGYTYIVPKYKDFNELIMEENSSDKNILKYRFQHNVKLDVQADYKKFSLGYSFRYNSAMENIDAAFMDIRSLEVEKWMTANPDGDAINDIRLIFRPAKSHQISFLVNNFLNNEYVLRPALIEAPRQFLLKYNLDL